MLTINTVLRFGRWPVTKHFLCGICGETFIMRRDLWSGFKYSRIFEMECLGHTDFCRLQANVKKLIGDKLEVLNGKTNHR